MSGSRRVPRANGAPPAAGAHQYRIGALVEMTGVPAVTIRMWERRHHALHPARSSKNGRLYDLAQVKRLRLLRALTEGGHAISTIAALSDEELTERLKGLPPVDPGSGSLRMALIGPRLAQSARHWVDGERLVVSTVAPGVVQALAGPGTGADVVVVEMDLIDPGTGERVDSLLRHYGARHAVVIYQFASTAHLRALGRAHVRLLQAPVDLHTLQRLLPALVTTTEHGATSPPSGPVPARRFSESELMRLSEQADQLRCECPRHLVDLVEKLSAFEAYSRQCESANARDALVHQRLFVAAAQARRLMEDALAAVTEQDGLKA